MRIVNLLAQFPLSVATLMIALIIVAFGWVNSFSDPLVGFLVFEIFCFMLSFLKELQKFKHEENSANS